MRRRSGRLNASRSPTFAGEVAGGGLWSRLVALRIWPQHRGPCFQTSRRIGFNPVALTNVRRLTCPVSSGSPLGMGFTSPRRRHSDGEWLPRMVPRHQVGPMDATSDAPKPRLSRDFVCAPGATRTPNLLIRSQTLYPIELRARELPSIAGVSGNDQPIQSMLGHIRRSIRCGVCNIESPAATGLSGELPPDAGLAQRSNSV